MKLLNLTDEIHKLEARTLHKILKRIWNKNLNNKYNNVWNKNEDHFNELIDYFTLSSQESNKE